MLSKLISYFEEEEYRGTLMVLAMIFAIIMMLLAGGHLFMTKHLYYIYVYLASMPVLFLATSRFKLKSNMQRGYTIFGSFFWLPTIAALVAYFTIRQLLFIPGYLGSIHSWLSTAKIPSIRIPSFRKDIKMGPLPGQGPFRNSQSCEACNRPL